jgi:YHS domain-containing protein
MRPVCHRPKVEISVRNDRPSIKTGNGKSTAEYQPSPIQNLMNIILIPLTAITIACVSCNKQESSAVAFTPEAGVKPYPLDACVVSGEKLGSMGEPVVINHEGQEVKFCCDSCVPKFKKDPAKFLRQLDQADHNH